MDSRTLIILLILISGLITLALAIYAWILRQKHAGRSASALLFSIALWNLGYTLEIAIPELRSLGLQIKIIGLTLIAPMWLFFSLDITNRHQLIRKYGLPILLPALIAIILSVIQSANGQIPYRIDIGVDGISQYNASSWYLPFVLYGYLLLIVGTVNLIQISIRNPLFGWTPLVLLLSGAAVTIVMAVVGLSPANPAPGLELTPLASALTALALAAMMRRSIGIGFEFDYETILSSTPDAVAVLDPEGQIWMANPAFGRLFQSNPNALKGRQIQNLIEDRDIQQIITQENIQNKEAEINGFVVYVSITTLYDQGKMPTARLLSLHDITQSKRDAAALSEYEQRYRALFNNSSDAIFIIDIQTFHIIDVNRKASELLGIPIAEIVGTAISEHTRREDDTDRETKSRRLLGGENVAPYERTFFHADGTQILTEVSITLVRDANGNPRYIQSIVRDIRERKNAEHALASERNLLRTLIDAIPDPIFALNREHQFILSNRAHWSGLGLQSNDAILGKNTTQVLLSERLDRYNSSDEIVLRGGQTLTEIIEDTWGGESKWFQITKTPLEDRQNRVYGLVGIARDITASWESERVLQRHLNHLLSLQHVDERLASTLDLDVVIEIALASAMTISGANAGFLALVEGESLRIARTAGNFPEIDPLVTPDTGISGRVLVNQEPEFVPDVHNDPDYQIDIPDTHALMSVPLVAHGNLLGLITLESSYQDAFTEEGFELLKLVTNRVSAAVDNARLYQYLQQKLNEVEQLERLKTDMIRMASHDLKNPLGIVTGYVDILKMDQGKFEPIYGDFFEAMAKALKRMEMILTDILSLERIHQQDGSQMCIFSLDALIVRAMEEYIDQARIKKQKLELYANDNEPAYMMGDEAQIYEAITNLISNAIKYTPEHGKIDVRLMHGDGEIIFEVDDTGFGIPEDRQKQLFEPFYRAKAAGTEEIEGTGLGLHLVKSIIERHKGQIVFKSTFNKGSTFGFRIPSAPPG